MKCNLCDTEATECKHMRILSVDTWRDGPGWTWNDWHHVGMCDASLANAKPRALFKYFRREGYLNKRSVGKLAIDDDQYNVVICERSTMRPLFAIEYGNKV
jgi:hypothetical protein